MTETSKLPKRLSILARTRIRQSEKLNKMYKQNVLSTNFQPYRKDIKRLCDPWEKQITHSVKPLIKGKISTAVSGKKNTYILHSQDLIWKRQYTWIEFFQLLFKTTGNTEFYIHRNLFPKKKKKKVRLPVSSPVYNKNLQEKKMK